MVIPIIFAVNNSYVKQLATVILSIIKNHKTKNPFLFYVLQTDITINNKNILDKIVKSNSKYSKIEFIDMKDVLKNFDLEKYMSRRENYTYISIETYFRFFIPELLPNIDKCIYIDADILVLQDIEELYNENILGYYAGVVQDNWQSYLTYKNDIKTAYGAYDTYYSYYRLKLQKKNNKYFNAGVLLLNLDEIRKDNIVDKLWEFAAKESPLEYQDQDVLNAVLEPKLKYINPKWNVLKDLNWLANQYQDSNVTKNLLKIYKKPAIVHYVGANKPWVNPKNELYSYLFIKEWWNHYKLTSYYETEDRLILKNILWIKRYTKWVHILTIKILGFVFIEAFYEPYILKFKIFNLLKTHIRIKKPSKYEKVETI